jgi:hypothetical protein
MKATLGDEPKMTTSIYRIPGNETRLLFDADGSVLEIPERAYTGELRTRRTRPKDKSPEE